ncbi:MAG: hypothetical protein LBC64_02395 [Fibromonadaceae bacterium]|nr:hypothetical protein [Fibromonadaceae bacterium]
MFHFLDWQSYRAKAAKAQTLQAVLTGKGTPSKQTNPQRCLIAFDVVPDF